MLKKGIGKKHYEINSAKTSVFSVQQPHFGKLSDRFELFAIIRNSKQKIPFNINLHPLWQLNAQQIHVVPKGSSNFLNQLQPKRSQIFIFFLQNREVVIKLIE